MFLSLTPLHNHFVFVHCKAHAARRSARRALLTQTPFEPSDAMLSSVPQNESGFGYPQVKMNANLDKGMSREHIFDHFAVFSVNKDGFVLSELTLNEIFGPNSKNVVELKALVRRLPESCLEAISVYDGLIDQLLEDSSSSAFDSAEVAASKIDFSRRLDYVSMTVRGYHKPTLGRGARGDYSFVLTEIAKVMLMAPVLDPKTYALFTEPLRQVLQDVQLPGDDLYLDQAAREQVLNSDTPWDSYRAHQLDPAERQRLIAFRSLDVTLAQRAAEAPGWSLSSIDADGRNTFSSALSPTIYKYAVSGGYEATSAIDDLQRVVKLLPAYSAVATSADLDHIVDAIADRVGAITGLAQRRHISNQVGVDVEFITERSTPKVTWPNVADILRGIPDFKHCKNFEVLDKAEEFAHWEAASVTLLETLPMYVDVEAVLNSDTLRSNRGLSVSFGPDGVVPSSPDMTWEDARWALKGLLDRNATAFPSLGRADEMTVDDCSAVIEFLLADCAQSIIREARSAALTQLGERILESSGGRVLINGSSKINPLLVSEVRPFRSDISELHNHRGSSLGDNEIPTVIAQAVLASVRANPGRSRAIQVDAIREAFNDIGLGALDLHAAFTPSLLRDQRLGQATERPLTINDLFKEGHGFDL